MFAKIKGVMVLFKAGESLKDPRLLKDVQAGTGLLIPIVIAAIAVINGFTDLQIGTGHEQEIAGWIAGVIVGAYGLFNFVSTVITTDKIGLPNKSKSDTPEG